MPYIIVDFQGQASAGGYLKVDGGSQIALSDDMMIEVSVGTHYLEFSSKSSAERGMSKLNAAVGNYNTAAWMEKDSVDGKISEYFPEKGVMIFTVVSDGSGHILDLPRYNVQEVDADEYLRLNNLYMERIQNQIAYENSTVGIEFWLCLLLGWLGVHKFYRGRIGMGILYLFTGGLFFLGWGIDTIVLLTKYIKHKRS